MTIIVTVWMAPTSQVIVYACKILVQKLSASVGTSACLNNTFYCVNNGHIGDSIPSSRVNDGLCGTCRFLTLIRTSYLMISPEPECCDGSDEPTGVCPNRCMEFGEEYAKHVALENKTRKTGAKIRATYIAYAQKEKRRLEKEISNLDAEIASQEHTVAKLRGKYLSFCQ
jgi:protein kinase C substrate 80K-H